jgi:hypothetical protein
METTHRTIVESNSKILLFNVQMTLPLTEFHLFSNLPIELRRKIWGFALPGPQIHRIAQSPGVCFVTSSVFPPVLTQVCSESRSEALHHLKLLPLPERASGPCILCYPKTTYQPDRSWIRHTCYPKIPWYFNPQVDTIYLPSHRPNRLALNRWLNSGTDLSPFRSVAVDMGWFPQLTTPGDTGLSLGNVVRRFGHVEVLHIITDDYFSVRYGNHCRWLGTIQGCNTLFDTTWVDPKEIASRKPCGVPCIWADWGPSSRAAMATDLRTDDSICVELFKKVVEHLKEEQERSPKDYWKMPKVELNYVRVDKKPNGVFGDPSKTEDMKDIPGSSYVPAPATRASRILSRWNWPRHSPGGLN